MSVQGIKCALGLHRYEVLGEETRYFQGVAVEKVIISRCTKCGKITQYTIRLFPEMELR